MTRTSFIKTLAALIVCGSLARELGAMAVDRVRAPLSPAEARAEYQQYLKSPEYLAYEADRNLQERRRAFSREMRESGWVFLAGQELASSGAVDQTLDAEYIQRDLEGSIEPDFRLRNSFWSKERYAYEDYLFAAMNP